MYSKNEILRFLKSTKIPYSIISKNVGVSRNTIYNWLNGAPIRFKNQEKLNKFMEQQHHSQEKPNVDLYKQHIELQNEKIHSLQSELEHLKNVLNDNPLQNKQWSEIDADFSTDVEVTISAFSPKQRRITNMRGMDSIKHLLQLTDEDEQRIWREDDWFEYEEHPCNQIIEKESLAMLQKETKAMPSLLESLKFFIGNYYMVIPVIYNYNNQRVVTHSYLKIGWKLKPITIYTKNVIIKD